MRWAPNSPAWSTRIIEAISSRFAPRNPGSPGRYFGPFARFVLDRVMPVCGQPF
jgi:hypothetical protein